MSHKLTDGGQVMHVGTLARVEGEGAMHIEYHDGVVTDVQLRIYEPPRFYEAFLRGRAHTEPPDITARICGICPVAYQTSSCWAIEDACGVEVTDEIRQLRRLLYCGEWIESHALHVFLLHAPDFLGYDGAIEMAADHPDVVERGLRIKKAGNDLMEVVGGRSIHPVNVRVGGFYRMPTREELRAVRGRVERARDDSLATVQLVSGFDVPDFEQPYEYLALRPEQGYPIEAGSVVTTSGKAFAVRDFTRHIEEVHVEHSHALHARLDGSSEPYVVGPLARYSLSSDRLSDAARAAAERRGAGPGVPQPVPVDRGARRRARRGVHRGAAADRRLVGQRGAERSRAAAGGGGLRGQRGPAGHAVPPVRARRGRHHPRRPDRAADLAEPAQCRGRPARPGRGLVRPRRPRPAAPLRAGHPQLRPVHLLRDPLPRPHRGPQMTAARPVPRPTTLVVGLGSADRGDDAVGGHVARAVAALADPRVVVVVEHEDPTDLIELWTGHDRVVVVDATWSGGPPGTLHLIETGAGRRPAARGRLGAHRPWRHPRLRAGRGGRAGPGAAPAARRR